MSSTNAAPPSPRTNASLASDTDSKGSSRRRQVVVATTATVAEQKSRPLSDLAFPPGNERAHINGRDLSHMLRREVGLAGARDQPMRGVIEMRPRPRRSVPKVEKPRWITVVNVLIKNAFLLMVLFWLGQAMWRWNYGYIPRSDAPFAALDLENRVSEVEALVKKSTKMTQVQLDVMERRTQLTEEKVATLEKDMGSLKSRADSLDKFLGDLRNADFLTKSEFEMFTDEFKQSASAEVTSKGFGLDDIGRYAREVIVREIEKHAADGMGRVDYALASGGAKILRHSETYSTAKFSNWLGGKRARGAVDKSAVRMLEPSFGEPGRCFALKGSSGFVEIKLRCEIIPDAITLEHVAKNVAYDRSSAPRNCRVWGWFEGTEDDPVSEQEKMSLLTEFSYSLNASNVQTFEIDTASPSTINMVRFEFDSNHGHSLHTCIYRFRVHGHEPAAFL